MRIGIVGGGIAGALLAWRLGPAATLYSGLLKSDATGASGGLVRAFATDPGALDSLVELRSSTVLREWSRYQEIGSCYVLKADPSIVDRVAVIEAALPGSVHLTGADVVAVRERYAGFISPVSLRDSVLGLVDPVRESVVRVTTDPAVVLANGATVPFDAVVLAAGPWTPSLLLRSGLPASGLRVRHIQYGIHPVDWPGVGVFVDDITGLYGRPYAPGQFLLGLPSTLSPDPDSPPLDGALVERVRAVARVGPPVRVVSSTDCYHDEPGLVLRGGPTLYTFTGGSGGAAKTALAQSRLAASALLNSR